MAIVAPPSGLLDLEKELSCSICTDTLYRPLTLLDCLHTFCGSCLKLWFAWQATQALADEDEPSRRVQPYTCPSCRAHVRGTRPDAKITTLLDMYLLANPGKGKSQIEKEDMDGRYKSGEDVIPTLEDLQDRRMVEEARRLSLRQAGRPGRRGNSGDLSQTGSVRRTGHEGYVERQQAAQLEHQGSLRSIISVDEVDPAEMEEEIMTQIVEDGLLDDIDLTNMTDEQRDQLCERIAEAYRRRHGHRNRTRARRSTVEASGQARSRDPSARRDRISPTRSSAQSPTTSPPRSPRRPHARSAAEPRSSSRRRTVHRDDLLQASAPQRPGHRRRSSDSRRATDSSHLSSTSQSQAARSETDLTAVSEDTGRSRRASHGVTSVDSGSYGRILRPNDSSFQQSPVQSPPPSSPAAQNSSASTNLISSERGNQPTSTSYSATPFEHMANQDPHVIADASYHAGTQVTAPYHPRTSSFSGNNATPGLARLKTFPEPKISCDSCIKADIQYELHYNCSVCKDGRFNICNRCYKLGKGCLNWFGFGYSAWDQYQKRGAITPDLPHSLVGVRYRRPLSSEIITGIPNSHHTLTKEPPAKRRRIGAFCYSCHEYADDFFYKCDTCNQGEWGFCMACVNQGRCCTHPLLPVAWVGSRRQKALQTDLHRGFEATFAPTPDPSMIQPFPPSTAGSTRQYRPLLVRSTCDLCHMSIEPEHSRLHCPQCSNGMAEFCKQCYAQLHQNAAIGHEDGEEGWRRCPRGHRMIVYHFQETGQGHRRLVVHDLVGGHFLKDEPDGAAGIAPKADERRYTDGPSGQSVTTSRATLQPQPGDIRQGDVATAKFPPDGGVGKRCQGRWSWIPEDGVQDELMFPKGAEITEVLDVNETWSEGSYAGQKGVFPTKYIRVLGIVTM